MHVVPESRQGHPGLSTANGEPADFEEFYRSVGDDLERLPWAARAPQPQILEWLDTLGPGASRTALVVACGLGDDAEELGRRGYRVSAFDISATAIGWCRRRFPDSGVDYRVADLAVLPADWRHAFDVVVEFNTIQSIGLDDRPAALEAIGSTVAPGGLLFVRGILRPDGGAVSTRPWPVSRADLSPLTAGGLRVVSFDAAPSRRSGHPAFVAVYRRP